MKRVQFNPSTVTSIDRPLSRSRLLQFVLLVILVLIYLLPALAVYAGAGGWEIREAAEEVKKGPISTHRRAVRNSHSQWLWLDVH
jgi:hypothetical protein